MSMLSGSRLQGISTGLQGAVHACCFLFLRRQPACHSPATNISSHCLQGGEAPITGNTAVLSRRCCLVQSMQQMLWPRRLRCKLDYLTVTCPKGQPTVFLICQITVSGCSSSLRSSARVRLVPTPAACTRSRSGLTVWLTRRNSNAHCN